MTEEFTVGDRVIYNAVPGNRLDGHEVAGEIVTVVRKLALIRPDDAGPGIMITTRHTRDIRKETSDG